MHLPGGKKRNLCLWSFFVAMITVSPRANISRPNYFVLTFWYGLRISMKKIGFLSFGHWANHPAYKTRTASDTLLQSIDLAVAAEEIGMDGAYFRVHHFAAQLASPFPLLSAIGVYVCKPLMLVSKSTNHFFKVCQFKACSLFFVKAFNRRPFSWYRKPVLLGFLFTWHTWRCQRSRV